MARNVYHVAYDPELFTADEAETTRLRDEERAARLQRGRNWDDFFTPNGTT